MDTVINSWKDGWREDKVDVYLNSVSGRGVDQIVSFPQISTPASSSVPVRSTRMKNHSSLKFLIVSTLCRYA